MKVTSLYVYPVKGLRGIPLQTATIGPQGVRHDRSFMLMTTHRSKSGYVKMQLSGYPECALFSQEIDEDDEGMLVVRYHPPSPEESATTTTTKTTKTTTSRASLLAQTAPPPLRIPLQPATESLAPFDADLHGSPASACRMGADFDAWFSQCLGYDTILVYIGTGRRRVLGETMKPQKAATVQRSKSSLGLVLASRGPFALPLPALLLTAALPVFFLLAGWMALPAYGALVWMAMALLQRRPDDNDHNKDPWITFTDCAPLMVASEASRANVNRRLSGGEDVPMYKFRPNIVVDGEGEWDEDYWGELAFHDSPPSAREPSTASRSRLLLTSNCVRCTSLNVDYERGAPAEGELGQVLKRLSVDRRVDPCMKYSPVFGRYAFLDGEVEQTRISVGDVVDVTHRNRERTGMDWPL